MAPLLPCITHLLGVIAAHCVSAPRGYIRGGNGLCLGRVSDRLRHRCRSSSPEGGLQQLPLFLSRPDRNQEVCRRVFFFAPVETWRWLELYCVSSKTCSCFCLTAAPRILERHDSHSHVTPPPTTPLPLLLLKLHPDHGDHQTDN